MLDLLLDPHAWASLATLTALEIVLGIDNIVFLSVASNRLAPERRPAARRIGLSFALVMRIALLSFMAAIIGLSATVITVWGEAFSWRDLVFAAGGLFLLTKGTREIHGMVEGEEEERTRAQTSFAGVMVQIAIFDLVFSIDSAVTAVGLAEHLSTMTASAALAMT